MKRRTRMHRKLSMVMAALGLLTLGAVPGQAQTLLLGQVSKARPPSVQIIQTEAPIQGAGVVPGAVGGYVKILATAAPGSKLTWVALKVNGTVLWAGNPSTLPNYNPTTPFLVMEKDVLLKAAGMVVPPPS